MKEAQNELQRALGNLEAMNTHVDAMEHTIHALSKQMEVAQHELAIMRLDLREVQNEVRRAVARLDVLRRQAEEMGGAGGPQGT